MKHKAVLASVVIASILIVSMISPIGPVYAHDSWICSSHLNTNDPLQALWAAVCSLEGQIDDLQNQINNLHGGNQSNVVSKLVRLTYANCTTTPDSIPNGWCPDMSKTIFFIKDAVVTNSSVVDTSTANPPGTYSPAQCSVTSVNVVEGPDTGFVINCATSPSPTTILNYIIFNPASPSPSPSSLTCTIQGQTVQGGVCACPTGQTVQNNVCAIPPPTCTIKGQTVQGGVCACPTGQTVQNNICAIPPTTHDDDSKKQEQASQFSNYKR